jgi:hypothetical protein
MEGVEPRGDPAQAFANEPNVVAKTLEQDVRTQLTGERVYPAVEALEWLEPLHQVIVHRSDAS